MNAAVGGAGREAERLHRLAMLGEVSGFVAHEFNNLLTPLLANAQIALRQPRDPERMALALERVVAGIKRATEVAESVMGLARAGGGGAPACVPRGTIGVDTCVREAISSIREQLGEVEVRVRVEPGLIAPMRSVDLGEVVLNLVLNAARAVRGSATPVIDVRGCTMHVPRGTQDRSYLDRSLPDLLKDGPGVEDTSDNHACVVEISDTGGGVRGEVLEGWRRRGLTVSGAGGSGGADGGSGMGMEICLRLVERAGGRIEVRSEPTGTTVRVVLDSGVGVGLGEDAALRRAA
jgi:two-component system cell cycle sensor histidine kinase/response regulator CckA